MDKVKWLTWVSAATASAYYRTIFTWLEGSIPMQWQMRSIYQG